MEGMGWRGWDGGDGVEGREAGQLQYIYGQASQAAHGYPAAGSSFCQEAGSALWRIGFGFQHAECIRASTL